MPLIMILAIFICLFPLTVKAQDNLVRNPQFAEVYVDYNARNHCMVYNQFTMHWTEVPKTERDCFTNTSHALLQMEYSKYCDAIGYIREKPEVRSKMMTEIEYEPHGVSNRYLAIPQLPLNDGVLALQAYYTPIGTQLKQTVQKGKSYEMIVRVALVNENATSKARLDSYFQNFFFLLTYGSTKHLKTRDGTSNKSNFDTLSQSRFFEQRQRDSLGWETWTCRFVASDSARYLTLAARWPKNTSSPQKVGRGFFYIDSVSLRAMTDTETTQHYDSLEANKQLLKLLELGALGFEYNKSALSPLGKKKLDSLATALKKEPPFQKLVLDGHTDKAGSPDYNKSLAQARAKAVQNYLVSKGLATELFYLRAYGSEKPVSTKPELNRRVEIKMLR